MKKVDFNKLQAGDLVEVPRTQFAPMRRGWNGWLFSEAVVIRKGVGRRAAHMERQRAPPKGREAKNGSRGIDSRGRIPERLCRCNGRYAQKKRNRGGSGSRQRKPAAGISLNRKPAGLQCLQLPCWQYGRQRAT